MFQFYESISQFLLDVFKFFFQIYKIEAYFVVKIKILSAFSLELDLIVRTTIHMICTQNFYDNSFLVGF